MLESLLNKVAHMKACSFIKKRLQRRCFHVNIAKFLITAFFIKHLRWLLLNKVEINLESTWFILLPGNEHSKTNEFKELYQNSFKNNRCCKCCRCCLSQSYWDKKNWVCRSLSKTSGDLVTKPKGKRIRTRWEGSPYKRHN